MIENMTIEEAKMIIDKFAARDTSNDCESEKRAKVLNTILKGYNIKSKDGSHNISHMYSLDAIGYLLGTSMQYVRLVEQNAVKKLAKMGKFQLVDLD